MKILVTGASGFIGGRFARFALEQGLDVRVTARRSDAVQHLTGRGAQFLPADLADPERVRALCADVDSVVHCAGAASAWGRRQDLMQANVQLTENVVEACLKQKVRRLVHLSSAALCFDGRAHRGLREEQLPRRFANAWAMSKYLAEQKVFGAQEFGLEVIALRPSMVIGAGDRSRFPHLVKMQGKNRLPIVGNGLNLVDFTSMGNLNQAILRSLQAGGTALGQVYNISNGRPVPLWDAINYVMRQMQLPESRRYRGAGMAYALAMLSEGACRLWPGRPQPPLSCQQIRMMNRDFTLDINRARHALGYEPHQSLWAGLDEFCAWWKTGHLHQAR